MTLKEHIETAKRLVKARKDLMSMASSNDPKCFKKLYKSEALRLYKVVRLIDGVKNTLDNVYFRSVDKKTFQRLGYIYYKRTKDATLEHKA
jgi:hypothetical protein